MEDGELSAEIKNSYKIIVRGTIFGNCAPFFSNAPNELLSVKYVLVYWNSAN
jgi:hypothetical protein